MIFFIQESAAQNWQPRSELVISAVESLSGYRSGAHQSGASHSLTLEENAALQDGFDSDSDASTVLLEEGPRSPREPPVPDWSPDTFSAIDPIFGNAEPIVVSQADPRAGFDMSNPVDQIIRRERERKLMMDSLRDPVAKVHGMDLFDISFQLHQLKWYLKNQVLALRPLSGLLQDQVR